MRILLLTYGKTKVQYSVRRIRSGTKKQNKNKTNKQKQNKTKKPTTISLQFIYHTYVPRNCFCYPINVIFQVKFFSLVNYYSQELSFCYSI